jgi:hypothetical protein
MERFTVAGTAVASNVLSQKIPVKIGTQKIDIVGTAGSGAKSTYAITIVRKGWTLASARGFTAAHLGLACMAAGAGSPYIGLVDTLAKYSPFVLKGDSSWTALPALPQDSGGSLMALDVIGGTPWLMSLSRNQINFTINFRKYSGGWITGAASYAGGYGALDFSLDHDKANVPHYSVELANPGVQSHYAYKWKDTAWTPIANGAAHDSLSNASMALNRATGAPVLAADKTVATGSYVAAVYTVSGTSYVPYGTGSTWPVVSGRLDLAVDSLGTPYVAYMDGNTKRIGVRKYNGSTWVELGPTGGFSAGDANSVNIAVIGGAPVVAYRDLKLAKVMSKIWTGTAWIDFGDADFVPGDAQTVRMAADNTAVWIAFSAAATGDKVTVMRRPLP